MRKKILPILITIILLPAVVPVHTYACGGFVALKGESVYHSVYCDLVEGCHLDDLRWYDTSAQAETAVLKPCDECSKYADWEYSCSFYEPNWKTDNHLLWTAMEMEFDLGSELGNENGYAEGFSDGKTGYEYSVDDYYEMGYDEGYKIGKENGYDYGYDDGVSAGKERAKKELREEFEEEYSQKTDQSVTNARIETAVICAIVFGAILYFLWKKKES